VHGLICALLSALVLTGHEMRQRSVERAHSELEVTFLAPRQPAINWTLSCRHPADPGPCQVAESLARNSLLGSYAVLRCPDAPALEIQGRVQERRVATLVDACSSGRFELLFGFALASTSLEMRREVISAWERGLAQLRRRNG